MHKDSFDRKLHEAVQHVSPYAYQLRDLPDAFFGSTSVFKRTKGTANNGTWTLICRA